MLSATAGSRGAAADGQALPSVPSACTGMYLPRVPPTASSANWQVTMPGLCPCAVMLPVIYRSFYSSCKEAVNYRRGIN